MKYNVLVHKIQNQLHKNCKLFISLLNSIDLSGRYDFYFFSPIQEHDKITLHTYTTIHM